MNFLIQTTISAFLTFSCWRRGALKIPNFEPRQWAHFPIFLPLIRTYLRATPAQSLAVFQSPYRRLEAVQVVLRYGLGIEFNQEERVGGNFNQYQTFF